MYFRFVCLPFFSVRGDIPAVSTEYGDVQGFLDKETDVATWLGVPYAAPPIGDLRWKPPQPAKHWRPSVLSTQENPKICAQADMFQITPDDPAGKVLSRSSSEDCLYLNVYSSTSFWRQHKPVMIFFPGGGYNLGGITPQAIMVGEGRRVGQYDVKLVHGDMVFVLVQYRLNVFGFAASSLLRNRDPRGSTGNYGILDQRFAMDWVKRNIAAFGGDSSHVLINGESGGGNAVLQHLVRPQSWNLFSAAATSSATYQLDGETFIPGTKIPFKTGKVPGNVTVSMQEENFQSLLKVAGCSTVECLLDLSTEEINTARYYVEHRNKVVFSWVPVIDGVDLVDNPPALASAGKLAKVPVVLGSLMEDEGFYAPSCEPSKCTRDDFIVFLHQYGLSDNKLQEALRLYANEQQRLAPKTQAVLNKWFIAEAHFAADQSVTCTTRSWARWIAQAGQRAFWFLFTHPVPFPADPYPDFHAGDLPYLFHFNLSHSPALDRSLWQWTEKESRFSADYIEYFVSFAKNNAPLGRVDWPAYNLRTQKALVMGSKMHVEEHYLDAKCTFQDSIALRWVNPKVDYMVIYE